MSGHFRVAKTLKPWNSLLCLAVSPFLWNNMHLKIAHTLQNSISTFCQVADQFLQQNNERNVISVFNYVVFLDFYESSFCWQFCNFKILDCVLPYNLLYQGGHVIHQGIFKKEKKETHIWLHDLHTQGGQCTSYIQVFFIKNFVMAEIFQPSDKIKLIFILF